ncbi:MAG: hypothetical protein WBB65_03910 [Anaerolineales bacterium]
MDFKRWLAEERLRTHKTNDEEIRGLLDIVRRDLNDASVPDLSTDRRFLIAYEGALTLATIPLYCAGYETYGRGHHWLTFRILPEVMGEEFSDLVEYFDQCRTKRNIGTYDRSGQISESELDELLVEVVSSQEDVVDWLKVNHSDLI